MSQRSAAKVLGAVGRLLVGAGVVILLFAAYQLWGTSLAESKAQDKLVDQFTDRLAQLSPQSEAALSAAGSAPSVTSAPATSAPNTAATVAPTTTALPQDLVDLLYPEPGEPVARIVIPRIGVDKVVVEGTETDDLRKGPGHFPDTPLPGQQGNAAIAGHRTTYGAPFGDIDQLEPGDEIRVSTVLGEAVYKVAGTRIVTPDQVEVVGDFGDNRLTLSACHPKFSAAQRIIVWAMLDGDPSPTIPKPQDRRTVAVTPASLPGDATTVGTTASTGSTAASSTTGGASSTSSSAPATTTLTSASSVTSDRVTSDTAAGVAADANHLAGDSTAWPGAVAWGFAALVAAGSGWVVARRLDVLRGKRRVRRIGVYALSSPAVLFCLFFCFAHVDRLLPAY